VAESRLRSRRRTTRHAKWELESKNHALDLAPAARMLDVANEKPRAPVFRRTVRSRTVEFVSIKPAFGGTAIRSSQSELFHLDSR